MSYGLNYKKKRINVKNLLILISFVLLIGYLFVYFFGIAINYITGLIGRGVNQDVIGLIEIGYTDEEIEIMSAEYTSVELQGFIDYGKYIYEIDEYLDSKYYVEDNLFKYSEYGREKDYIDDIVVYIEMGLDKPFYSLIDEVEDVNDYGLMVNKYNTIGEYIPSDLVPLNLACSFSGNQMRTEAASSFEKMCFDMKEEGLTIIANSGYRSYTSQKNIYDDYYDKGGQEYADTYVAHPGHSEHQTGLAVDVVDTSYTIAGFEDTAEYNWIINNGHKYGYILRYLENKQYITGYGFESWHLRYVGVDIATDIYENGWTLEEYYFFTN